MSLEDAPKVWTFCHYREKCCVHHTAIDGRRLTLNQIANIISIFHVRVENILYNELGMTKVSSRLLSTDQKRNRLCNHGKIY